jgi:3-deoxy-manno-octulosonate cytidylyltransferase (CMP-KDO synthetase)
LPRGNDLARTIPAARTASRKSRERCECDAVINIQGDEPLIDPAVIDAVAARWNRPKCPRPPLHQATEAEYEDPNVVKVVVNAAGRALYFSRRTIPYVRDAASAVPLPSSWRRFHF